MTGGSKKKHLRKFWLLAASASAALMGQSAARAQTSTSEEIVVTATQRESSLQDVAVAVTPVTAGMIEKSGVRDLQDLTSLASTLQFNVSENETSATARIRGVGTQGSNPGLESAVGVFVDGVYRARNGVALTDLGEVGQIEVLRGPQGTLFGRNTSAGLISIRTAGPDMDEFSAIGEATIGNFNERRASLGLTGPLVADKLAGRIFVALDQRDGFLDVDDGTGATRDVNDRNLWTTRGQLLITPNENVDIRLIADYAKRDEECCAAAIIDPEKLGGHPFRTTPSASLAVSDYPFGIGRMALVAAQGGYGAGGLAALQGGDPEARIGFADRTYDQDIEDWGLSGEVNWDLGGMTLTSISAYRDWSTVQGLDGDYSALDLLYRPPGGGNGFEFKTFTQEFRLAGIRGPLDWLVGAYYANENLTRDDMIVTGADYGTYFAALDTVVTGGLLPTLYNALAAVPPGSGYTDMYEQDSQSIALFTHNIYALNDTTDITVGLRFTHEEKEMTAAFDTAFSAQPLFAATVQGVANTFTGDPAAFDAFASCNPAVGSPAGGTSQQTAQLAQVFAVLRSGYCAPWLRNNLDATGYDQSRDENEWSGVVSIAHNFTDSLRTYASYSRGYKAGGFNLDRNFVSADTSFEGEFVNAFELGAKTVWFNGDLILNLAAHLSKFEDFQLNTFNGIQFVVASIPEVESKGVEADAIWSTPLDGLSYQGGVAYTRAEYGGDDGWVAANANPITGELTLFNLPNSRVTNSPLWTVTNAFTYERALFDEAMNGLAYIDFRYVTQQNTGSDLRQSKEQPDYFLVNGRLGLSTPNERYAIELWARNLTDETYAQVIFDVPLQAGTGGPTQGAFLGDPRTYGVTLRARY